MATKTKSGRLPVTIRLLPNLIQALDELSFEENRDRTQQITNMLWAEVRHRQAQLAVRAAAARRVMRVRDPRLARMRARPVVGRRSATRL